MLNVTIRPILVSFVMLSVTIRLILESVVMLNVTMLSVAILNVVRHNEYCIVVA
jgi:hypothetical protein